LSLGELGFELITAHTIEMQAVTGAAVRGLVDPVERDRGFQAIRAFDFLGVIE
jgi:hypothetical protein